MCEKERCMMGEGRERPATETEKEWIWCQCNGYSGPIRPFMAGQLLREQYKSTCEETCDPCAPPPNQLFVPF